MTVSIRGGRPGLRDVRSTMLSISPPYRKAPRTVQTRYPAPGQTRHRRTVQTRYRAPGQTRRPSGAPERRCRADLTVRPILAHRIGHRSIGRSSRWSADHRAPRSGEGGVRRVAVVPYRQSSQVRPHRGRTRTRTRPAPACGLPFDRNDPEVALPAVAQRAHRRDGRVGIWRNPAKRFKGSGRFAGPTLVSGTFGRGPGRRLWGTTPTVQGIS